MLKISCLQRGESEGRRRERQRDEMVGWHHRLNGREPERTRGRTVKEREALVFCRPWGCKESDTIERLNSKEGLEGKLVR